MGSQDLAPAAGPRDRTLCAQGWRLKRQGWRFLTQKRNALDTSVVLISFVILALDMTRISLHQKHMAQHRQDPDG